MGPVEDGLEYTLLLRCRLWEALRGGCIRGVMAVPGASLVLAIEPPMLAPNIFDDVRWTWTVDGRPKSGRLLPDDVRWKEGCCGRLGASDMRDEDMERA